jgi:hypothetical protein
MNSRLPVHLLDEIFGSLSACLSPEVARRIIELRAGKPLQDRIDELAEKCNQGELSDEERSEYELYVVAGSMMSILQARAKRILADQTVILP